MKQLVWLAVLGAVLSASRLSPFQNNDVAALVPVETLTVDVQQGQVVLDGGDCQGYGKDWDSALEDLCRSGDGTVFLGTAEQVVLSQMAVEQLLPDVIRSEALRPAAGICVCSGKLPSPKDATAYLSAHPLGVTIQKVQAVMLRGEGLALPMLIQTEGGLRLNGTKHG